MIVNEDVKVINTLGPEGSYLSGLAATVAPGLPIEYAVDGKGCNNFPAVISALHALPEAAGLIAIHNTLSGPLNENVTAYQDGSLRVESVAKLAIRSHIMGLPSATLEDMRYLGGKDVALDQVTEFMKEHQLERVEMDSTAAAGKYIRETGDRTMAAVGSLAQAEVYELEVLAKDVQDPVGVNLTTVLLTRSRNGWAFDPREIEGRVNLSGTMIMRVNDSGSAGSLYRALGEISERDINLTAIESLSIRGTEGMEFFLTFSGLGTAIADLATSKTVSKHMSLDILGVYDDPLIYNT